MERESACHLVKALRLSFDSPEAADELEEFIVDLLETVEFGAKKPGPVMRETGIDSIGASRGVPLTDG